MRKKSRKPRRRPIVVGVRPAAMLRARIVTVLASASVVVVAVAAVAMVNRTKAPMRTVKRVKLLVKPVSPNLRTKARKAKPRLRSQARRLLPMRMAFPARAAVVAGVVVAVVVAKALVLMRARGPMHP
jgi:hypothetical protein